MENIRAWSLVLNWKENCLHDGYPKDKIIYMYYTDQRIKYNPSLLPTSIIIVDKILPMKFLVLPQK
jgi:hypothetical protein